MHLPTYIAPLILLLSTGREAATPLRAATPVPATSTALATSPAATSDAVGANRRYHFYLWNFTTETINVHLSSSLVGCSTTYNNIAPGQAFERGNYNDKWDRGKICAGACWTSVDAYTTNGDHHVVHFTPSSTFPAIKVLAGAGAANIAVGMVALVTLGPVAAAGLVLDGGAIALAGVLSSGGPCSGFNLAIWRDPQSGGWAVTHRYDGDYDVFKSEILPKVGK